MIKWLKAFRLRTLPLALSCIITGSFSVYGENFRWEVFTLAILTTILLQILSNLANDYGDFVKGTDNEERVGPQRSIQSGEISASQMKKAVIICAILSLLSGVFLLGETFKWTFNYTFLSFFILGIASIISAIKYTVGKKALAYHALGDVFVFIFFGLVGVIGSAYLQTFSIQSPTILLAVTIGCWSSAVLNLNNMRDYENDANSNKNTIVVRFGIPIAKRIHTAYIFAGTLCFVGFGLLQNSLWIWLGLLTVAFLFVHLKNVLSYEHSNQFDPELKKVALLTFLFSIVLMVIQLSNA